MQTATAIPPPPPPPPPSNESTSSSWNPSRPSSPSCPRQVPSDAANQHKARGDHRPNAHASTSRRKANRSSASSSRRLDSASTSSPASASRSRPHSIRSVATASGGGIGIDDLGGSGCGSIGEVRNRSSPHLDSLSRLAAYEHRYGFSPITTPSSPILTTATTMALTSMSHRSSDPTATLDPTLFTTADSRPDTSNPSSPVPSLNLNRNDSGVFDPSWMPLHRQTYSASPFYPYSASASPHPDLPDTMVAVELAQQAAQMQQAAQLIGLQRLFASRSTSHLPNLHPTFLENDFESPPPYAPTAAESETELERGADLPTQQLPPRAISSQATLHRADTDPPLPPPISIPLPTGRSPAHSASSARGSHSGPPSPSASRRVSNFSPIPPTLGMTHLSAAVSTSGGRSDTVISPVGFSNDSDGEEDRQDALTFSSTGSRRRRNERQRLSASGPSNHRAAEAVEHRLSSSLGASAPTSARATTRTRSGSIASLQRPWTTSDRGHSEAELLAHQSDRRNENRLHTEENRYMAENPAHCSPGDTSIGLGLTDGDEPVESYQVLSSSVADDGQVNHDELADALPVPDDVDLLVSEGNEFDNTPGNDPYEEEEEFPPLFKLFLHPLRMLAAVPGLIGTYWLVHNTILLASDKETMYSNAYSGYNMIAPDSVARAGAAVGEKLFGLADGSNPRITRRQPGALDFAISCLWSIGTAYHALSFTTLLLRRWLLYYSILPSLIRLVALQAICWPLVRLTVHIFGPDQPLGAWVAIGTTTALSDIVARWVTSNIADAPLEGEMEDESEDETIYLSDRTYGSFRYRSHHHPHRTPILSGDESDVSYLRPKRQKGGSGTRFWRAVIGGPIRRHRTRRRSPRNYLSGTETEMDGESGWDRGLSSPEITSDSLLRRRIRRGILSQEEEDDNLSDTTTERNPIPPSFRPARSTILPIPNRMQKTRVGSRRHFHWDVAMLRNVLPVVALGYLSMWVLILDGMRIGSQTNH